MSFYYFWNHLAEEERAGCFTIIVLLLSCGCYISMSLPRTAIGEYIASYRIANKLLTRRDEHIKSMLTCSRKVENPVESVYRRGNPNAIYQSFQEWADNTLIIK